MSLINEALKRAKQTQTEAPPPPLQFRGADKKHKRRVLPVLVGAAVTLIFVGGLSLLAILLFKRQELRLAAGARTAPPMPEVSKQSSVTTPVLATELPPAPGKTNDVTERPPAPSDGTGPIPSFPGEYKTNSLPVSVQNEPAGPTSIKLQGILFNPAQPSAVVNGRTVYVGSVVGGSRVTRITQQTVTFVSQTATNVLSLSE